jgi:hypothetical protein
MEIMNRKVIVALAVLALLVGGVLMVIFVDHPRPTEGEAVAAPRASATDGSTVSRPDPRTELSRKRQGASKVRTEAPDDPGKVVTIRPGQVLATVNGVQITLKDLIPVRGDHAEAIMTEEEFEARLARAIDRELTFQAAANQKLELTPVQQASLDRIRADYDARLKDTAVKWSSVTPEQIEFEVREMTARQFQATMVEAGTGIGPHITPAQVEQYYQNHLREYGELPSSPEDREVVWQHIDFEIRRTLAQGHSEEFEYQVRQLLDWLRSLASVTVSPPST